MRKEIKIKVIEGVYPHMIDKVYGDEFEEGEEVIIIDNTYENLINKKGESFGIGKYIGVVHKLDNCFEIKNINNYDCWYSENWK